MSAVSVKRYSQRFIVLSIPLRYTQLVSAVGDAVREAIARRVCNVLCEELFITSKLWVQDMANYDLQPEAKCEASLKKSGLDWRDLLFCIQAVGDYF